MSRVRFTQTMESALGLKMPYLDRVQQAFSPDRIAKAKPAAVLLLFAFPDLASHNDPHLLFTRRTESVETHKGQIAFPGGHCEQGDVDGPVSTALRETEEEVGVSQGNIQVLGTLPSLMTITNFIIHPVVGLLKSSLEEITLTLSEAETAEVVWIPLKTLENPGTYRQESITVGSTAYPIDVFQVDHHRIWGATGSMTKNVLDRLKSLR